MLKMVVYHPDEDIRHKIICEVRNELLFKPEFNVPLELEVRDGHVELYNEPETFRCLVTTSVINHNPKSVGSQFVKARETELRNDGYSPVSTSSHSTFYGVLLLKQSQDRRRTA